MSVRVYVSVSVLSLLGCGAMDGVPSVARPEGVPGQELPEEFERPEIGVLTVWSSDPSEAPGSCTATVIIRSDILLTAAHCVWGRSGQASPRDVFKIRQLRGTQTMAVEVPVRRYRSFAAPRADGRPPVGPGDIAVIQLSATVPPDVAPAKFTATEPNRGTLVTTYGYGYGTRSGDRVFGNEKKRKWQFEWPSNPKVLTKGDSGGPVIDANGTIFAVNSAYGAGTGRDQDVFAVLDESLGSQIGHQIAEWDGVPSYVVTPGQSSTPVGMLGESRHDDTHARHTAGKIMFGTGAAGFLGAGASLLASYGIWKSAACTQIGSEWSCTSDGDAARQRASTAATAAGWLFAGASAVGGTGLLLWLLPSTKATGSASVSVWPTGVQVHGTF